MKSEKKNTFKDLRLRETLSEVCLNRLSGMCIRRPWCFSQEIYTVRRLRSIRHSLIFKQ